MNRLDRALGILLLLRSGKPTSAAELAGRFEVSTRTIYRDIETLSSVGVPVYAEMGRAGGFRLLEGYFLPPVMFSVREAVSLFLGLTLLRSLRATPFAAEQASGEHKLLAALPDTMRAILAEAHKLIGFEGAPGDAFHPERPAELRRAAADAQAERDEGATVGTFIQAVLDRRVVALDYRSPYRAEAESSTVAPSGVLWDRDRWYLVGKRADHDEPARLWRADRVLAIRASTFAAQVDSAFDVRSLLQRNWLQLAMTQWAAEAPVVIQISRRQAERLKQDWYYRQARFEQLSADRFVMTFGEDDQDVVLELLRWLGPEAELIRPEAWRATLRAELLQMLAIYHE